MKRCRDGALKPEASSNEDAERAATEAKAGLDQDWLQKTAEEIQEFGVDEVSSWVQAALKKDNYADEAPEIAGILKSQKVKGTALLKLTFERLVDKPYNIVAGPAEVLAERIAALSAPPTAASGFQDDPAATEFIRELAEAMPEPLREGVQVFNLKTSLPVEPYDQSGPKLLTRNTTRRAWKATFELMKGGTKRVAMLGVPGIGKSRNLALGLWHLVTGQLPDGIPQPEAIVFEARQSSRVFLFTKGQGGGQWKVQSRDMQNWSPSGCPHLQHSTNWYLVDAFEARNPTMLVAKTVIACSPDRNHYSNFIKGAGCCVFIESWSKSELQVASDQIRAGADMLSRYDKIGGNLRALLSAEHYFDKYVKDQESEAKDWQHLQPAFCGTLDNQGKKLLTRLFTYISKDALKYEVDFCCAGAAALVANAHYDKLVELWRGQDEPARYWFQKFVGPLLTFSWFHKKFAAWTITNEGSADRASWQRKKCTDLMIAENLQLVECDSTTIFEDRWQKALQNGTLAQQVLSSPAGYPGIDYLLEFNHGIQVTTSGKHNLAQEFRQKLKTMFNGTRHSFTLTFFITGDPERFAPVGGDFNALMNMAGPSKSFDNVCVQVVQIPKTLNSLS